MFCYKLIVDIFFFFLKNDINQNNNSYNNIVLGLFKFVNFEKKKKTMMMSLVILNFRKNMSYNDQIILIIKYLNVPI